MNNKFELEFVNNYITKGKRERLLYELTSKKKRKNAISRFCHNTLAYIDKNKVVYEGNTISVYELEKLIKKYSKNKEGYVISWESDIDGRILPIDNAINEVIGNGMASIVIFSNVILIETEQEQGAAIKYVLALD